MKSWKLTNDGREFRRDSDIFSASTRLYWTNDLDRNRNAEERRAVADYLSGTVIEKVRGKCIRPRDIAYLDRTTRDKSYREGNRLRDFLNYWDRFGFSTAPLPKLNLTLSLRRRRSARAETISNWNSGEIMEPRYPTLVSWFYREKPAFFARSLSDRPIGSKRFGGAESRTHGRSTRSRH